MNERTMESLSTTLEIRMRGEVAYTCSLMESALIRIIFYYKNEIGDDKPVDLRAVLLAKKIEMAESRIKKKNINLYHKPLFDFLKTEVVEFRNIMLHSMFTWKESDLLSFTVWDIQEKEGIQDYCYTKKFEINYVKNMVDKIMDSYNALMVIVTLFEREFFQSLK